MLRSILIVEEDASVRRMLTSVLEGPGYMVTEASDPRQALEILSTARYDLVLSDLHLLKRGGSFGLLREVREMYHHCRVVVMTTYGDIGTALQAVREGAHDFVTKPVDPDHLLRIVNQALRDPTGRVKPILSTSEY